ncbi:MAG: tRNA pseudouridine(55) synthase TruB [Tissierellia bacterium]|nr:tRNA pseudouridine(55) synthase TruB [Tissierellia bacterium]
MLKGAIAVNKEVGISSQKAVSKVKKLLSGEKVGHAGTLDLEASGVLVVLIGKATRISDYIMNQGKEYIATIKFGEKTDTLDYSGKVIAKSEKEISKEEFENKLCDFKGEIYQIPPMYSALKKDGKKLYELAIEGKSIERKKRKVNIYDIELLDFNFPYAKIKVSCSKGTYIRTLADDIGESLLTYAHLDSLVRTRVGKFLIEDSIDSSNLSNITKEDIEKHIIPIDRALYNIDSITIDDDLFSKITNGMKVEYNLEASDKIYKIYCKKEFIGLGIIEKNNGKNLLRMKKVFYDKRN